MANKSILLILVIVMSLESFTNGTVIKGIVVPMLTDLATKLGEAATGAFITGLEKNLGASSSSISTPYPGAVWISVVKGTWGTWDGYVTSMYFHPTRDHAASTKGKLGVKTTYAKAGEWAVSKQTKAIFGNKAYYKTM